MGVECHLCWHILKLKTSAVVIFMSVSLLIIFAYYVLLGNLMDPFSIHIGIILSILDLSPHGFVFRLYPQKASYQLDVIHAYKLISLSLSN